jgi:uncharacterized membrane protein YedE/YeeE
MGEDNGRRERELVRDAVVRLRSRVMALVFAMVGGAGLFLTTVWHLLREGRREAPNIELLNNYFPGYSVTWPGALLGLAYGAITGAVLGWVVAWVYNRVASRREGA